LVAAAKFLVAATKNLFAIPNFVTVTKPFFSVCFQDNTVNSKREISYFYPAFYYIVSINNVQPSRLGSDRVNGVDLGCVLFRFSSPGLVTKGEHKKLSLRGTSTVGFFFEDLMQNVCRLNHFLCLVWFQF